jgi:hypothetical protein
MSQEGKEFYGNTSSSREPFGKTSAMFGDDSSQRGGLFGNNRALNGGESMVFGNNMSHNQSVMGSSANSFGQNTANPFGVARSPNVASNQNALFNSSGNNSSMFDSQSPHSARLFENNAGQSANLGGQQAPSNTFGDSTSLSSLFDNTVLGQTNLSNSLLSNITNQGQISDELAQILTGSPTPLLNSSLAEPSDKQLFGLKAESDLSYLGNQQLSRAKENLLGLQSEMTLGYVCLESNFYRNVCSTIFDKSQRMHRHMMHQGNIMLFVNIVRGTCCLFWLASLRCSKTGHRVS